MFPATAQRLVVPEVKSASSGLALPNKDVRPILGKKLATATPTWALAARRLSSACRMSGRRSSRVEGRPAGMSTGSFSSSSPAVRSTGAGLRPSSTLIWFSLRTIWRSSSGMLAAVEVSRASALAVSSLDATPCSRLREKILSVSAKDWVFRLAISNCRSSSSSSK